MSMARTTPAQKLRGAAIRTRLLTPSRYRSGKTRRTSSDAVRTPLALSHKGHRQWKPGRPCVPDTAPDPSGSEPLSLTCLFRTSVQLAESAGGCPEACEGPPGARGDAEAQDGLSQKRTGNRSPIGASIG